MAKNRRRWEEQKEIEVVPHPGISREVTAAVPLDSETWEVPGS